MASQQRAHERFLTESWRRWRFLDVSPQSASFPMGVVFGVVHAVDHTHLLLVSCSHRKVTDRDRERSLRGVTKDAATSSYIKRRVQTFKPCPACLALGGVFRSIA